MSKLMNQIYFKWDEFDINVVVSMNESEYRVVKFQYC